MNRWIWCAVGTVCLVLGGAEARAQTRGVTAEDFFAFESASDPRISPDGSSVAFVVTTMDEAIDVANEIAPEHLTLSVDEPFDYLEKIRHAGALFLGRYTPPSVAD